MNDAILIDHSVRIGRERPFQSYCRVEFPVLIEVNNAKAIRGLNRPLRWRDLSWKDSKQCGLATAVWPDKPEAHARLDHQVQAGEKRSSAYRVRHSTKFDELFRPSIRTREIDADGADAAPRVKVGQLTD